MRFNTHFLILEADPASPGWRESSASDCLQTARQILNLTVVTLCMVRNGLCVLAVRNDALVKFAFCRCQAGDRTSACFIQINVGKVWACVDKFP